MAVTQSESVASGSVSVINGDSSEKGTTFYDVPNRDEILLLSSLKQLVSSGEHRLDTMLAAIADAARRLTNASGAAIAMWKNGAMVCRARSGTTAPPLGAQLSAETGISGECLRTGKAQHCSDTENDPRVDVEVCRSLGLRSIAVLPIHGWRGINGINGIVEVFSTVPRAFTEHHLALLEQLTALAERARASQPHGASQIVAKAPIETPRSSGFLPASDPVGEVAALALEGKGTRHFLVGALAVGAVLVGLVIWLGWRGPDESDGKAHAASPPIAAATVHSGGSHFPDNDPVWKANPGGEPLFPSGKPSAGSRVKFASKIEVVGGRIVRGGQPLLKADAAEAATPRRDPGSRSTDVSSEGAPLADGYVSVKAPTTSSGAPDSFGFDGAFSAKATIPAVSAPVSQGITGGLLLHRTTPVYPDQAKALRLEGRVVLNAMVSEDGSIASVKLVHGSSELGQSAVEAVKQWRYEPFMLEGKPVRREITIAIDFKVSPDAR